MLSVSLLFAFILSFALPGWRERFIIRPLTSWSEWLVGFFSLQESGWLPVVIIGPLLLAVAVLVDWFGGLFLLVLYTLLAWAVLDVSDSQSSNHPEERDSVFHLAGRGLFCGAFWFVLIHPLVAVGYRLVVWLLNNRRMTGYDEWSPVLTSIRDWMEWPASFFAALFLSLAGNTRNGLRQLTLYPVLGEDMGALNRVRLYRVGEAALGDQNQTVLARDDEARQMAIRAFLFALLALWVLEIVF